MRRRGTSYVPHLLMASLIAIWAGSFVVAKVTMVKVTPFALVASRFLIGSLCVLPFFLSTSAEQRRGTFGPGVLAGLVLAVPYFLQMYGVRETTASMGGFVAARQPIVDLLRQRGRPYLFSNALSPAHVGGAREAIRIAAASDDRRDRLMRHTERFRSAMTAAGFTLTGAGHPIVPVMFGDANVAVSMAERLMELGVYVTPFSFPVVPHGQARIRTQMSAALTDEHLDTAIEAFKQAADGLGIERSVR